jgi:hypothetical protein
MTITDPRQAGERLLKFVNEDRLVQGSWSTTRDGREMACLLGAAADIRGSSTCPASLMPQWMAHALPGMFDALRTKHSQAFALSFGEAMMQPAWEHIRWDRVKDAILAFCVQQAHKAVADYPPDAHDFVFISRYATNVYDAARAKDVERAANAAAKVLDVAIKGETNAHAAQADYLMALIQEELVRG